MNAVVPPRPPWLQCPEIPAGSIGWRMGCGEDVLERWAKWWNLQSSEQQRAYAAQYPEPAGWAGFYIFPTS